MSGQQIGSVLGLVVGSFFGAPQLGMAIGGLIGGLLDPAPTIRGPRIADGQTQSSTDGTPIAWVQGTAKVAGTIIAFSDRRHVQVDVDTGGKGGPPKQTQDQVFQDFAILVCESCSLRDSSMQGIILIEQDGHIVYDARAGGSLEAIQASSKYARNMTFMFGAEDQLPHPTLEAIYGVGNTNAYRGSLVVVFTNFNVGDAGNRIPNFLFTVVSNATVEAPDNVLPLTTTQVGGGALIPSPFLPQSYVTGYQQTIHFALPTSRFDITGDTPIGFGHVIFQPLYADEPDDNFSFDQEQTREASEMDGGALDTGWICPDPFMLTQLEMGFLPGWSAWWGGRPPEVHAAGYTPFPGTPKSVKGARMMTGVRITYLIFFGFEAAGFPNLLNITSIDPEGKTLTPLDFNYYADPDGAIWRAEWTDPLGQFVVTPGSVALSDIVAKLCRRGGLTDADLNVVDLAGIDVLGYPIAKPSNATDCLGPILQAYFAYGSEYDQRLNFHLYGANTVMEIMRADLLEANDANKDAVIRRPRNQATEFPRRITGSYVDPAQNYNPVNVAVERTSINVIAIGDQILPIPVTMTADAAIQAIDKALKVAYALLEGTVEFSVPFGASEAYLKLVAGDAVAFQGRRYALDEVIVSNGYLKLTGRYDRQSAYTSTVEAIPGNIPTPPDFGFSGPTSLMAMNLPALRPQDTRGIYLTASSLFNSAAWAGCVVQISFDNQVSWQTACQILTSSTMGALTADEPGGGEPLTVKVNHDLETVTDDQLAARANGFALLGNLSEDVELGQFKVATEVSPMEFELTDMRRPLMGTPEVVGKKGDQFTMLAKATFLPIDLTFAGRTLYLRAVGFGENTADAGIVRIVYNPVFNHTVAFETASTGDRITTSSGDYIEVTGT